MNHPIFLFLIASVLTACLSEKEEQYYAEIPGIWQPKWHADSTYVHGGCEEFTPYGGWRRHDGCTVSEGIFRFHEDTLLQISYLYQDPKQADTNIYIVVSLDSGTMTTYNPEYQHTTFYRKIPPNERSPCWPF